MFSNVERRLKAKLEKRGDCLIWTGSTSSDGYGCLSVKGKNKAVHRLAWELENGPIPAGLLIRHTCDTPLCCNINHLLLGTNLDNKNDAVTRGRHNKGEDQRSAKLTENQVREIRDRYSTGDYTQKALAAQYSITQGALAQIVNRKTWKHI